MRNSLWLALLLVSVSCTAPTLSVPNLEYLRCPTASMPVGTPDTGAGGGDTSIFGSSTKTNPNNCINDQSICKELGMNFTCDTKQGCCTENVQGKCNQISDCTDTTLMDNKHEICNLPTNNCGPCSTADQTMGNAQCAAWAPTQVNGAGRVICLTGTCVECKTTPDCTKNPLKPVCDSFDNTCKGCLKHTDCASQVCKLDSSLLQATDTIDNLGECVKTADVALVDNTVMCDPTGPLAGKPFCQVSQALGATNPKVFPYIRVAGSPTVYGPIMISTAKRVAIVGPAMGRDLPAAQQSVINGVVISGAATVTLSEVAVGETTGAPAAIQCSGSSTLNFQKSFIGKYGVQPNAGIIATGCTVDMEKSKIYAAQGYGLSITNGSGHRVVNNVIIRNGLNGLLNQPSGMRLNGAPGLFSFNTIAGNMQGVQCDTQVAITNSIVISNPMENVSATCQTSATVITAGVTLNPNYSTMGEDPTLTAGQSLCIDLASKDPTVKDDYLGKARPQGAGYDIGFQEIQ